MKFLSILAAASLALAPAIASAGSDGDISSDGSGDGRPISGPLAGRVLDQSVVPVGAIILGGLVLFGGAVIAILSSNDSNNKTND